ncbi:MAG: diguanylate cyclase domain-containing protein [Methylobacter sp.]
MNKTNLQGMRYSAMTECVGTLPQYVSRHAADDNPFPAQLRQALSELAELKQETATSQQQLKAAQQQIETLEETNGNLRQELLRLSKKYTQALHFAYHDKLTGLANRSLLMDRLKQAMAQSRRKQKQLALLFIDMDKFKGVNDRLGHEAGDNLLQQVAKRLTDCVRFGDTVCRYGGDEFLILLPEIDGLESLATVTGKIRDHLAASYNLGGNIITLTASIGASVYDNNGQDCSDLIKQADTAMYLAKTHNLPTSQTFECS